MSDRFRFTIVMRPVEYFDRRTFWEYVIRMWQNGIVVGEEESPRRIAQVRFHAMEYAKRRIDELKTHKLFAILITKKHIEDGQARCGSNCAIAQALWHNQERMGLLRGDWDFCVVPYAAWVDADGITLGKRYGPEPEKAIPLRLWPEIVTPHNHGSYRMTLQEWAQDWDDWAESRYMSLADWREERGYTDGERPYRPSPCSFVLDLDAFTLTV